MQAAVCARLEGPDAITLDAVARPLPGRGEVLVRVHAAALNFPDLLMTRGSYQFKPALPFVIGMELAGEVVGLGEDVSGVHEGARVIAGAKTGACAEFAVVAAQSLLPWPWSWSAADAAAFRVGMTTAYHALVHRAEVARGETVAVTGASGGVGLATVQLARHRGARVLGLSGSPDKWPVLKPLVDAIIDVRDPAFATRVKEATDGRGADVVVDTVGGNVLERCVRAAAPGGRIVLVGFASGSAPALASNHILIKRLSILGARAGEASRTEPSIAADYAQVLPQLMTAGLKPIIASRRPLTGVADGLRDLDARRAAGKIVIDLVND
jgi:NADPH2:quinone reductase